MSSVRSVNRIFERLSAEDAERLHSAPDTHGLIYWAANEIAYGSRDATSVLIDALLEINRRFDMLQKGADDWASRARKGHPAKTEEGK